MSEETRKAKSAVPKAMVWSIGINGALGVIMAGVLLIYMGDVPSVLGSANPFATILLNTTGSKSATTVIMSCFILLSVNGSITTISSVSRLTWAWARDGGLPAYFTHIHPKYRIPVRSVWLSVSLVSLICLLNIGSGPVVAFSAITSLSSFVFFFSYSVAFACLLYSRLTGRVTMGEWNLGRWGVPINILVLVYDVYIMIFLPFPSSLPVSATTMNYSGPVFGFVLLVIVAWWFGYGRKRWEGPNLTIMEYIIAHS